MIQRIQTLFLLLASASFGIMFQLPMATSDKVAAHFLSDKEFTITDHLALSILTILGVVTAFIAIFLYKNRKQQIKLGYAFMAMAVILPLASFLLFKNDTSTMDSSVHVKNQIGIFFPLGAVLFGVFANYFIRKDEQLVKSMDRLR